MDLIFEFILDLILEGSFMAATEKKVPLVIRILAALILVAVYLGLGGVLLYIGIKNKSILFTGVALILCIAFAAGFFYKLREAKKRDEITEV